MSVIKLQMSVMLSLTFEIFNEISSPITGLKLILFALFSFSVVDPIKKFWNKISHLLTS
jgi:hypothetical protein